MSKYPQADAVSKVREESQMLGEFLEWVMGRYDLCKWIDEAYYDEDGDEITKEEAEELRPWEYHYEPARWMPLRPDINRLLAEYYSIDYDAYQDELHRMLVELRGGEE